MDDVRGRQLGDELRDRPLEPCEQLEQRAEAGDRVVARKELGERVARRRWRRRRRCPLRSPPSSAPRAPPVYARPRARRAPTSSSTRLVTVTGTATLPVHPASPIRRRNRSRDCSTGISMPRSSTRNKRSPARSKTAPKSAPIAATSRRACADRLADRRLGPRRLGREPVRRDRLEIQRAEHERKHERGRRVPVVDDDPELPASDRLRVERREQILGVLLADTCRVGDVADRRRTAHAGTRGG